MKNKLLFGLLISAFTSLFLSNVRADIKQDILVNLYTQLLAHPQEKIYLQCDRSCYINGENIYFRAYNINPSTRKPSELIRYVYVELISPFNEVVLRQQIRPDDERLFHGVLEIPTELPEGDYKLRGYTRFMENIDVEHFYSKTIYIADPNSIKKNIESQVINENNKETLLKIKTTGLSEGLSDDMKINISLAGNNKKKNSDKDDSGWSSFKIDNKYLNENRYVLAEFKDGNRTFSKYIRIGSEKNFPDIYFYPEGGEIVYGKDNKIAFKALMPNGEPAELTGNIFDADNKLIIAFNTIHEGMGSFILNNAGDKKYYAEYNYNGSLIKKDLPDVNRSALSLKLDSDKDHVNISVNSADNNTDNKYYLLILRHGVPMLIEEWDFENNNLTLGNDKFLPGVLHIVLINENMNIMSERLYFNNKTESVSMELLTDKNSYKQRSRVLLDINIDEVVTDTVYTSFAISVIDDNDILKIGRAHV